MLNKPTFYGIRPERDGAYGSYFQRTWQMVDSEKEEQAKESLKQLQERLKAELGYDLTLSNVRKEDMGPIKVRSTEMVEIGDPQRDIPDRPCISLELAPENRLASSFSRSFLGDIYSSTLNIAGELTEKFCTESTSPRQREFAERIKAKNKSLFKTNRSFTLAEKQPRLLVSYEEKTPDGNPGGWLIKYPDKAPEQCERADDWQPVTPQKLATKIGVQLLLAGLRTDQLVDSSEQARDNYLKIDRRLFGSKPPEPAVG